MQIWALLTALHMAKWLHQSLDLSVLTLSPGMGEYYSPSNTIVHQINNDPS